MTESNTATLSDFFIQQDQLGLNDLVSPKVQLTRYDLEAYSDELYQAFEIHQPLQAKLWSTKRKAQYLAGRLAAREALRTLKLPEAETPIPSGNNREPIWPKDILGSISHSDGFSVATVMNNDNSLCSGIGLDIQPIVTNAELALITSTVLTKTDRLIYQNNKTGLSQNQLFTLIFSAKESFFKAAYASVGEYFDFDAISVSALDVEYQQITLVCERDLSPEIQAENEYPIFVDILEIGKPIALAYSVV